MVQAVERAKQVTMTELNVVLGVGLLHTPKHTQTFVSISLRHNAFPNLGVCNLWLQGHLLLFLHEMDQIWPD